MKKLTILLTSLLISTCASTIANQPSQPIQKEFETQDLEAERIITEMWCGMHENIIESFSYGVDNKRRFFAQCDTGEIFDEPYDSIL